MSGESETVERVLLVVAEPELGPDVITSIRDHVNGRRPELRVVAPALIGSPIKHAMGDVDEAREEANSVLDRSLTQLRSAEIEASGTVGDADPTQAIRDALATFPADEIVIVTRPDDEARFLEGDLFDRARHEFEQPIVHLEVDPAGTDGLVAEEEAGAGIEPPDEGDAFEGHSRNTPKLGAREIVGILVAVVGSILAIVLAATNGGNEVQRNTGTEGVGSNGSAVFAYIVAGVITLINMAHVVGLMLFEAAEYRGGWARAFSWLSRIGTPIAVILVLIAR